MLGQLIIRLGLPYLLANFPTTLKYMLVDGFSTLTHHIADGHFAVNDTAAGSHPLQVTGAEMSLVTAEILMIKLAIQHVRHRFKAPDIVGQSASPS